MDIIKEGACEAVSGWLWSKMKSIVVALALVFLAVSHEVEGGRRRTSLSEEDLELEREARQIRKNAVKSIKTVNNDIFDCVDINRQPALNHPLLRNHTVRLKPSQLPKGLGPNRPPRGGGATQAWPVSIPDGGCPTGTVPIERYSPYHRKKMKSFFQTQAKTFLRPADSETGDYHVALTQLNASRYHGAQAAVSIHQEPATDHQLHRAMIVVSNGCNFIQVGWMVNKAIYGDGVTRFFTMWTADNYDSTGCMNTYCPGFVQVSSFLPLSISFDQVSVVDGTQYDYPISLFQDPVSWDWWLVGGPDLTAIGYWPSNLFTLLNGGALFVEFGGYLYMNDPSSLKSPPMGSGKFAEQGYGKAAYFREVQVIHQRGGFVDPPAEHVELLADRKDCYTVGAKAKLLYDPGYHFYYGGPGGSQCNLP